MNTKETPCSIHPHSECSCGGYVSRLMREPSREYTSTRRDLLRRMLVGGVTLSTLTLYEEAEAGPLRPSTAEQKKLGRKAAEDILKKYKEVEDDRARSFRRVGNNLVNALPEKERTRWDFSFRVVNSKEVNAFALPGGPMFIFTGLLDRIQSADELAAVTGHELAHVREEHWAKQYESEIGRTLGLELLLGVTRTNGVISDIARTANGLYSLNYSRKEEDQADDKGLQNMNVAGYDPGGMIDLFETLKKATGNKNEGPDFLRSHPLTDDRIRRTRERIAKLKQEPRESGSGFGEQIDRTSPRERAPSPDRDRYRDPNPDEGR